MPKVRKKPQRTCVACRRMSTKGDLVRIVRTPAGEIKVDTTGKLAGRGAYLCPRRECWRAALDGKRIAQALKHPLTPEECAYLQEYMAQLPEGEDTTKDEQ